MTRRPVDLGNPDRLYTVTGGRSRADGRQFDLVTLVVAESVATSGMQSEHARILRICARPTAMVEISAELGLPVTVVRILLDDLLGMGHITARHPQLARSAGSLPDSALLTEVLHGLRNL